MENHHDAADGDLGLYFPRYGGEHHQSHGYSPYNNNCPPPAGGYAYPPAGRSIGFPAAGYPHASHDSGDGGGLEDGAAYGGHHDSGYGAGNYRRRLYRQGSHGMFNRGKLGHLAGHMTYGVKPEKWIVVTMM